MARHHYIPISVLRTFASADAWKIVKVPVEIRKEISLADRATLDGGQVRNWPVVVYEKDSKKLGRKAIGQVCSASGFYAVQDPKDGLRRALLKAFFRFNFPEDEDPHPRPIDFEDFIRRGKEPLEPDLVERTSISRIDGEFANLLPLLRCSEAISKAQLKILLRFVAFARCRTPTWRRQYFPELYERRLRVFKEQMQTVTAAAKKNLEEKCGSSFDGVTDVIEEHFYHAAMMEYSSERFDPLSAMVEPKVKVFHTTRSIPFVTCDNPSRPYHPNRLDRIFDARVPGFKDRRVHILYPISPLSCITVSSNPSWREFSHQTATPSLVRSIHTALAIIADRQIVLAGPDASVFQKGFKLAQYALS